MSKKYNGKKYDEDEIPKILQKGKNKNKSKKVTVLRVILIILLILIIMAIAVIGAAYWYINDKIGMMQQVEINEEELGISTDTEESLSGYRNIALFGVDSREDDYGKGNRSDCIIIASINNKTKEVRLISVYRDSYVKIDGHGLDKITHAYSYGEAQLALNTLNTNLDLNIKEFVTVNFNSVSDAVDALGGVTINITSEELKYINDYIDATAASTNKKSSHITKTGRQTLDGVQAVAYSRIRYTSGGDYKRTERMRDVIEAMLAKLKTKNVGEINKLANQILPEIYTNLDTGDVLSVATDVMNYKITKSIGWPYETKGITLDRWYGIPVTLESNVKKLHEELFDEKDYVVPTSIKNTSDSIIKKTGYK